MRLQLRILWFLFGMLPGVNLAAQRIWTGLVYRYEPAKQWQIQLEGQFRTENNWLTFDRFLTESEIVYDPNYKDFLKPLEFSAAFRYIGLNDNSGGQQGFESHFRYQLGAAYKWELKRLQLGYRLRYQRRTQMAVSDFSDNYPIKDWRHRWTVSYDLKNWKLDPELSLEFFFRKEENDITGFNKYRLRLETDWKVKKGQRIKIFLFLNQQTNLYFDPDATWVAGAKYRFSKKRKKQ